MSPYTKEDCLTSLQTAAEQISGNLSKTKYQELGLSPSTSYIAKTFGTWNEAKKAANLQTASSRDSYSQEDCTRALQKAAIELGKSPTIREYDSLGLSPSRKVIKRLFENWNSALNAADLGTRQPKSETESGSSYTKEDCIKALRHAKEMFGRSPSADDYRNLPIKPSYDVIVTHFECWNDAKAEAELFCFRNGEHPPWKEPPSKNYYGPNWVKIREKAILDHGEKCKNCLITRECHADKYGRDLHVHHLIQYRQYQSRSLANHPSNLVPLCEKCHCRFETKPLTEQCNLLNIPTPPHPPREPDSEDNGQPVEQRP